MTRRNAIDWQAVDWSKSDIQLAFKYDCNQSYIGSVRKKLGKPKPTAANPNWSRRRLGVW
jgi:hypothetical protein